MPTLLELREKRDGFKKELRAEHAGFEARHKEGKTGADLWPSEERVKFERIKPELAKVDFCSCLCINPDNQNEYSDFPQNMLCTIIPMFDPLRYPCELNNAEIPISQGALDGLGVLQLSPTKKVWTNDSPASGTPTDIRLFFYCDISNSYRLATRIPSLSGGFTWSDGVVMGGDQTAPPTWSESDCTPVNRTLQEMRADPTTCEIIPGVGPQGLKHPLCPDGECLPDSPANAAFLAALAWKIVMTAAP